MLLPSIPRFHVPLPDKADRATKQILAVIFCAWLPSAPVSILRKPGHFFKNLFQYYSIATIRQSYPCLKRPFILNPVNQQKKSDNAHKERKTFANIDGKLQWYRKHKGSFSNRELQQRRRSVDSGRSWSPSLFLCIPLTSYSSFNSILFVPIIFIHTRVLHILQSCYWSYFPMNVKY